MDDKKTITITIEEYNLLLEKQKQVDELKERLQFAEEAWEEDCDNDLENLYEQIIKGTAKEIADWLITTESNKEDLAKIIKEHYDVE